jgi:hypothetical protein
MLSPAVQVNSQAGIHPKEKSFEQLTAPGMEGFDSESTKVRKTTEGWGTMATLPKVDSGLPPLYLQLPKDVTALDSPQATKPIKNTSLEDTSDKMSSVDMKTRSPSSRSEPTTLHQSNGNPEGGVLKVDLHLGSVPGEGTPPKVLSLTTQAECRPLSPRQRASPQSSLGQLNAQPEWPVTKDATAASHQLDSIRIFNENVVDPIQPRRVVSSPSPTVLPTPVTTPIGKHVPINLPPLNQLAQQDSKGEEATPAPTFSQTILEETNAEQRISSESAVQPIPVMAPPLLLLPSISNPTEAEEDSQHVADAHASNSDPESATDAQEIADMLLPKSNTGSVVLTDEELLAIGLGYPD